MLLQLETPPTLRLLAWVSAALLLRILLRVTLLWVTLLLRIVILLLTSGITLRRSALIAFAVTACKQRAGRHQMLWPFQPQPAFVRKQTLNAMLHPGS